MEDVEKLETPNADKRTEETKARLYEGSGEARKIDAGAIADENAENSAGSGDGSPG